MNNSAFVLTNDKMIRTALKDKLLTAYKMNSDVRIIEELGVCNGAARIDIALVNGLIHGYELKSDMDTLERLPEQMRMFNSVFDKMTIVVGKNHLLKAMNIIPEWWGITIAKATPHNNYISFCDIREAEINLHQDHAAIAALLWRDEALNILEEVNGAAGVRSKTRKAIYERLAEVLDGNTLRIKVREYLCTRVDWRSEIPCMLNGG